MRNDEGGEGKHGEGMKREGRSKMAWKERRARARALRRWIKLARVQARTEGEEKGGERERESENMREK